MNRVSFSLYASAVLLLLLVVFFPAPVHGQQEQPAWLLMVEGQEAFREGNYGTALSLFRKIVERDRSNADAHLWIGYVFEAEGEYRLAKRKYEQSLEHERRFTPYERRIAARYALAQVARKMGETELYTQTLGEIIEEGRSEELSDARVAAVVRKMKSQGPDKVMELYRIREKDVRRAYSLSGEQALREQDYERAVRNYSLAFGIVMTTAIEEMQRSNPGYEFLQEEIPVAGGGFFVSNTRRFLSDAENEPRIDEYFSAIRFYRDLFLFAAALYGSGEEEKAEMLWLITAEHREAGVWSALAREQAAEPNLEELPSILER
jgi:tetratricopeptide (TPR) repeat protein